MSGGKGHICGYCREACYDHCTNLMCAAGYWNTYSTHPEECDDYGDPVEERCNRVYSIGRVGAAEDAASQLRERSGETYAAGRDDEAKLLRRLAEDAEETARKLRLEHNRKYHRKEPP